MTFVPIGPDPAGDSGDMNDENADADRVIVGVDGSASSIAALRYAARIADALGAPLEAITTWSSPPFADTYLVPSWSPKADARSVLDAAVELVTPLAGKDPGTLGAIKSTMYAAAVDALAQGRA